MKSDDITEGLDLLGDFLDAKGYTEEAGLCTRAMDEINRLYEWKDKAGDIDRVKTVEIVDLRAENARLEEINEIHQRTVADLNGIILHMQTTNARLREALKPFANEAWKFDPAWKDRPDPTGAYYPHWEKDDPPGFTIGDLRAARAAMGESDE